MENLMNLNTTSLRRSGLREGDAGALYVQHFNVALINFEKHVKEERRFRRLSKARQVRKS